jgi:hypothetical protein
MAEKAFEERQGTIYYYIFDGKIARKADPSEEGTVTRTNKLGKPITEKYLRCVSGALQSATLKYIESMKCYVVDIALDDIGQRMTLSLPFPSAYSKSFAKFGGLLKKGNDYTISAYSFLSNREGDPRDKKITGLSFYEGREARKECQLAAPQIEGIPYAPEGATEKEKKIAAVEVEDFYKELVLSICEKINTGAPVNPSNTVSTANRSHATGGMGSSPSSRHETPFNVPVKATYVGDAKDHEDDLPF